MTAERNWRAFVRERLALPGLDGRRERDAIEEVASQLEDLYLDSMRKGASPEEAQAVAESHITDWAAFARDLHKADRSRRRARGDQWSEEAAENLVQGGPLGAWLADLLNDIRYALRGMRNTPAFSFVALLTLALGIGGATAIFTLYDKVLLRPLPYADSEELVELWEQMASFENAMVAYPNFLDWRERNRVFEDLGVWNAERMTLTGSGEPQEVLAARVSASIFPILRVYPVLGRTFSEDEDRIGATPVAMLGHAFWTERFGSDPGVLGRTLILDDFSYEIVGVLPEGLRYPPGMSDVDLYVPVEQFAGGWIDNRGSHPGLLGLARLRPGVTLEQAAKDLERIALELEAEYPGTNTGSRVHVEGLKARVTRNAREPITLLLLAVGSLFLIACINVANLILARATGRQQEMAVRASLGAGRGRIFRLLLTETLFLWALGGALGLYLAWWCVSGLARLLAEEIPPVFDLSLDLRVAGAALGLSLLTGLTFGLPPALRVVREDLREFLKEGRRTAGVRGRNTFRTALIVAEVSLAVALVVGSGLAARSVSRILAADPGLDPSNVVAVEVNLPPARYPEEPERTAFYSQVLEGVRALPDVQSAATGYVVPLGPGGWQNAYHVEGTPPEAGGQYTFAELSSVSSDYFATLGIPLLRGREFTLRDDADAPPVVVVDQAMADRYWPGEEPVGKRIKWGSHESENPWMEVVGVVGQVKVNGVVEETLPQMYIPHWQDNDDGYYLMVKSRGDPLSLVDPIRRVVAGVDPTIPLASVGTLEGYARETTRTERILALLMGIFSAGALLLAGVGVYGVTAQLAAERRHEIGVRVALGARQDQVLGMVLKQGLASVGVGVFIGLGLAWGLGRLMAAQLFGVTPTDPLTFLLTPLAVVGIAILANLLPARRAMKVDPVRALQAE